MGNCWGEAVAHTLPSADGSGWLRWGGDIRPGDGDTDWPDASYTKYVHCKKYQALSKSETSLEN